MAACSDKREFPGPHLDFLALEDRFSMPDRQMKYCTVLPNRTPGRLIIHANHIRWQARRKKLIDRNSTFWTRFDETFEWAVQEIPIGPTLGHFPIARAGSMVVGPFLRPSEGRYSALSETIRAVFGQSKKSLRHLTGCHALAQS